MRLTVTVFLSQIYGDHRHNYDNSIHVCFDLKEFVCLFVLRFNVPVNIFSVMSGRSQRFLGLTSTVGSRCALLKDTTR